MVQRRRSSTRTDTYDGTVAKHAVLSTKPNPYDATINGFIWHERFLTDVRTTTYSSNHPRFHVTGSTHASNTLATASATNTPRA